MKILIAADGSPYTKRMLAYLAAHDELFGPNHQYTIVHSVLEVSNRVKAMVDAATVTRYHDDEAAAVLDPIRAFFAQHGIEASFVQAAGHAAQLIAELATEGKFDLLVMGSRGHGNLLKLVLGSVTTEVIARCSTPVLLVR